MVVEEMPVVCSLLCALSLCGNRSADVRWDDAREGIKALYRVCFEAPSHNPAGVIKNRI